jgi:ABC-type amino acid transport substrate-binding protein
VPKNLFLIPSLALVAALSFAACGSDDAAVIDRGDTPTTVPAADPAGIEPAKGHEDPGQQIVTGRVVGVDRDGPSVEVVEVTIVTGTDATDAARAAGEIGPEEEWELDHYVMEGNRRWIDIDPAAAVAVYDCTQACEHVEGTLEQVLTGAPYGGSDALWNFFLDAEGRAAAIDEIYQA